MRTQNQIMSIFCCVSLLLGCVLPQAAQACSTVMLKKGESFIIGHNLDQAGVHVTGFIVVNKRGVFKQGRTASGLLSKDGVKGSSLHWVSKYGSVTFNVLGRDLVDGGVNDQGLYILEMSNVFTKYPAEGEFPKLSASNWMQYVLDNFHTVEEVVEMASAVILDGFGDWHFFVADRRGNFAAIDFVEGNAVVHSNDRDNIPVPALFNRDYEMELRRLESYKGFGGQYDASMEAGAPRIVQTAVMLEDYQARQSPVDYGFMMLSQFSGDTPSQWSVVFDYSDQRFYFKTDFSPGIKTFSLVDIDFSNRSPARYLDIDTEPAGEAENRFKDLGAEEMLALVKRMPFADLLSASGGMSLEEFNNRMANHHQAAALPEGHYFVGTWSTDVSIGHPVFQAVYPGWFIDDYWQVEISADRGAVIGTISNEQNLLSKAPLDNIHLVDDQLSFTVRVNGSIVMIEGVIREGTFDSRLYFDGVPIGEVVFSRSAK